MSARKKDVPAKELPVLDRFPLSVIPVKGESYCGFLHRLAARNMLPSLYSILKLIGTYPGVHRLDDAILRRLSTASGFAPTVLEKYLGAGAHIGHSDVHWGLWCATPTSRICPQCFEEAPIHRQVWQHRFVDVCPVHECPIVSGCPDCGSSLWWWRPRLTECGNGHNLRRRQDGHGLDSLIAVTRHFYERFGLGRPWPKPVIHEEIASLSNDDFVVFVRRLALLVDKLAFFGSSAKEGGRSVRAPTLLTGSDEGLRKAMEMISHWPTALHELLEPFVEQGTPFIPNRKLLVWIRAEFLRKGSDEAPASYRLIRQALMDIGSRLGDTHSLRRRQDQDELVTISEVQRRTGLPRAIIQNAASKFGWEASTYLVGGRRTRVHVKLSDVENWFGEDGGEVITVTEASTILGVKLKTVLRLASMGLLGVEAQSEAARRAPTSLKRSDVEALLRCLRRQRKGPAKNTRYPAASCTAIRQENGKVTSQTLSFLIEAVAAGKLRYWGEPNAPQNWHLHEEDFEKLLRKQKIFLKKAA